MHSDKTTTNIQLEKIMKNLIKNNNFIGVYMADEIPIMKNNDCLIMNTDPYKKSGVHWCSLIKKNNQIFFYDSFNRDYKKLSKFWVNKNWLLINHKMPEESIYSSDCGQLSCAFLYTCETNDPKLILENI